MRQFVACKFRADQDRTYTYHNDGEPVAVGDKVQITARDGIGKQTLIVAQLVATPPQFETKPILGLAPPEPGKLL